MKNYAFHQWSVSDVIKHLETDLEFGLSDDKAAFRLKQSGPNSLREMRETSVWAIFFRQFSNFFVLLLLVAGVISYFIDGPIQAIFLLIIVIINIALGFFQEYKAEKSISELSRSYRAQTEVIRDGSSREIENEDLVVGDLVELVAGNKVPADIRIIDSESLGIDESTLTGESVPSDKKIDILPLNTPLAERANMAYAGTLIVTGHGRGIVTAVGLSTEFGKIADSLETKQEKTPLEKQVIYLSKIFAIIAIVLAFTIFGLGMYRHLDMWELLTFTIALFVGMVPESLPTAITLALSVGVSRMVRKKAIVRRLAVVETLGSVNIIATDKTGTLTRNNLEIGKIFLYQKSEFIEGTKSNKDTVTPFLTEALACSNINLNKLSQEDFIGDPIDRAIAESAEKFDPHFDTKAREVKRLMEVPFDSAKKYMAVLVSSGHKKMFIAKGSVEKIIEFCHLERDKKKEISDYADYLSKSGYKVIALSSKSIGSGKDGTLSQMEFRGLIALVDEPAPGVKEAIAATIKAGIRPIIITGDHPETARFVASAVGLEVFNNETIVGKELLEMSDRALAASFEKVKIFARVTPEDKIRIVELLKKSGYCVAVTGDGTNDAPALKSADVGIAMGRRGTDVARDAADIVLVDDHYSTIVAAIEYGRTIFDNIRNVIILLISGNFNEVLLIIAAFVFALPVPLTTIQILWINVIMENLSAITLSFERPHKYVLSEKPRPNGSSAVRGSIGYALLLAIISFSFGFGLYLWGLSFSIIKARTLVFCFIVILETVYAFSIRSKRRIWQSPSSFLENKYLVISTFIVLAMQSLLFLGPIRLVFGLTLLSVSEWLVMAAFVLVSFLAAEVVRYVHDSRVEKGEIRK